MNYVDRYNRKRRDYLVFVFVGGISIKRFCMVYGCFVHVVHVLLTFCFELINLTVMRKSRKVDIYGKF